MWYDSTSLYGRRSGSENTGGLSVTCCLNIVKLSVWVLDHYRIISNVLLYVSASVEIIPHVQTQGPFLSFSAQGSSTLDVSPRCVNHQSEAEKLCWCSTASPRCIKRRLNTEVLCVYITFTFSFHQPNKNVQRAEPTFSARTNCTDTSAESRWTDTFCALGVFLLLFPSCTELITPWIDLSVLTIASTGTTMLTWT